MGICCLGYPSGSNTSVPILPAHAIHHVPALTKIQYSRRYTKFQHGKSSFLSCAEAIFLRLVRMPFNSPCQHRAGAIEALQGSWKSCRVMKWINTNIF